MGKKLENTSDNGDTIRPDTRTTETSSTDHLDLSHFETTGACLKALRQTNGYSIDDISQGTKIKTEYVVAIEEADYAVLPTLSFAAGFVKIYAGFLGQNADLFSTQFRSEMQGPDASLHSAAIAVHPARKGNSNAKNVATAAKADTQPSPSGLAIAAIIAVIILAVWIMMNLIRSDSNDGKIDGQKVTVISEQTTVSDQPITPQVESETAALAENQSTDTTTITATNKTPIEDAGSEKIDIEENTPLDIETENGVETEKIASNPDANSDIVEDPQLSEEEASTVTTSSVLPVETTPSPASRVNPRIKPTKTTTTTDTANQAPIPLQGEIEKSAAEQSSIENSDEITISTTATSTLKTSSKNTDLPTSNEDIQLKEAATSNANNADNIIDLEAIAGAATQDINNTIVAPEAEAIPTPATVNELSDTNTPDSTIDGVNVAPANTIAVGETDVSTADLPAINSNAVSIETTSPADEGTENAAETIIRKPLITAATVSSQKTPPYPERCANRANNTENVQLIFDLTTSGEVINARVTEASNSCFNMTALRTIRKWRFNPKLSDGRPIASIGKTVTMTFTK